MKARDQLSFCKQCLFLLCILSSFSAYGDWYRPRAEVQWYIQLQGELQVPSSTEVVVLDLFDTPAKTINRLQRQGKKVICYFSAGSFEEWRPDAHLFSEQDLGLALDGWPGENWLDIRSANVRGIMLKRLKKAQRKNCDAVDPDNVDGYSNESGFALTPEDQLEFNRFLAKKAHRLGLGIGLKNNLEQASLLAAEYDFATNESCTEYDECHLLESFTSEGKPVLHIEYGTHYYDPAQFQQLCTTSTMMKFSTIHSNWDLDGEEMRFCLQ